MQGGGGGARQHEWSEAGSAAAGAEEEGEDGENQADRVVEVEDPCPREGNMQRGDNTQRVQRERAEDMREGRRRRPPRANPGGDDPQSLGQKILAAIWKSLRLAPLVAVPVLVYVIVKKDNASKELTSANNAKDGEIRKLEAENREEKEQNKKLANDNKTKDGEIRKLEDENRKEKQKNWRLVAENTMKTGQIWKLLLENQEEKQKNRRLVDENKTKDGEIRKLESENQYRRQQYQRLADAYEEKETTNRNLKAEIKYQNSMNERLKGIVERLGKHIEQVPARKVDGNETITITRLNEEEQSQR